MGDLPLPVRLRYFASLREALGDGEMLPWQPGLTLQTLRGLLVARGGEHARVLGEGRSLRGAVDQHLAAPQTPVPPGAEVAFFPPVTGG